MNKIKLASLVSLLVASAAQASSPCEGFEIKIENSTPDSLLVRSIHLKGADIQPSGISKINGKSVEVFTVNNSIEGAKITGEMTFDTMELDHKEVKIQFDLSNDGLICNHDDHSPKGDLEVEKTRLPSAVKYTIK